VRSPEFFLTSSSPAESAGPQDDTGFINFQLPILLPEASSHFNFLLLTFEFTPAPPQMSNILVHHP